MERPASPITGNISPTPFMTVTDRLNPKSSQQWQLVQDPESELIYLSPCPDETEMAAYYPTSCYDPHLSAKITRTFRDTLYLALRNIALGRKASLIEQKATHLSFSSKILEIGCSSGELLHILQQRNSLSPENCIGFEKDGRTASLAKKNCRLDVKTIPFCESSLSGTFDRIIFWHALEHIHRINETLDKAARYLDTKGAMIIALPNAASFDATVYGKHWVAWDAPRHLYHFTPQTLGKLLKQHNLEITSMQPFISDTLYNCIYSEKNMHRMESACASSLTSGILRGIQSILKGALNNEQSSTLVYVVKRLK
ncbi:class I SAM-dependent methyltransferase [Prosthecochloris sp. SCSIO W1101]|uniref:class I SAM-dependent methyltransferase n=1 Tax=Prosthecochloris sp. SCSIO W1101 TaxID=2992242 RepID=UPI00223CD868|nr:class I SAM-dependent methyltransferase [Prosthecochloris sp. SCSIO W1101]UZJ42312.1 class I SAM-dependent methyltransferase [Prosthecochloris sp. SCSIO W1101]